MNFSKLHKTMLLLVVAANLGSSVNAVESGYLTQVKDGVSGIAKSTVKGVKDAYSFGLERAGKCGNYAGHKALDGLEYVFQTVEAYPKTSAVVAAAVGLPVAGYSAYKLYKALSPKVKSLAKFLAKKSSSVKMPKVALPKFTLSKKQAVALVGGSAAAVGLVVAGYFGYLNRAVDVVAPYVTAIVEKVSPYVTPGNTAIAVNGTIIGASVASKALEKNK